MMTRRERLMATLRGEQVDRPAVNFYEIGGFKCDPNDPDQYNVYNGPSWRPLIELANGKTDIVRFARPEKKFRYSELYDKFFKVEKWQKEDSKFTKTTLSVAGQIMTQLTRRDTNTDTIWVLEHLLKSPEDAIAFLQIPDEVFDEELDCSNMIKLEHELGDAGIIMVDIADPLCRAAELFSMEEYTIVAMTEPDLFSQLLQKFSRSVYANVDKLSKQLPDRLWRIYGPEYACKPYLPPHLFEEYVVQYTGPIVKMIQKTGGYARLHAHGNLRDVLPHIAAMGVDAIDPIEPAPQGDIELIEVCQKYGSDMVLFGNLEITDIENLEPDEFEPKVVQALEQGTSGQGRGFVLMPSAAPYGRTIKPSTMKNYETMVKLVESWS